MLIRETETTRKFLATQPVVARRYEWHPLYEVGNRVITIINGRLLATPFKELPTHEAFCDWLSHMPKHWLATKPEAQL